MKKEIKKQVNQSARDVVLYGLFIVGITLLYTIVKGVILAANQGADKVSEQMMSALLESVKKQTGVFSICGVLAVLLYFFLRYREEHCIRVMGSVKKSMEPRIFVYLFCIFMSCQMVFTVASALGEILLNPFGYTLSRSVENATSVSSSLSLFLYSALTAPIGEELIFRGFIMKKLLPYGKGFAILISAVLFGILHSNYVQGIYAVSIGLVLGYVAVEYSLKWSVVMHILNNMVFSDILGRCSRMFSKTVQTCMEVGIFMAFFAAGCVIIIRYRKSIASWWRKNRPEKGYIRYAMTSAWMLILLVLGFLAALNGVGRL